MSTFGGRGFYYPERPMTLEEEEPYFLREMMQDIIDQSNSDLPAGFRIDAIRNMAERALDRKFFEDVKVDFDVSF